MVFSIVAATKRKKSVPQAVFNLKLCGRNVFVGLFFEEQTGLNVISAYCIVPTLFLHIIILHRSYESCTHTSKCNIVLSSKTVFLHLKAIT